MRILVSAVPVLGLLLFGTQAMAQGMSGNGPMPAASVPVVPDTALAVLSLPADVVAPMAWSAGPDTVVFGGTLTIVPAGEVADAAVSLSLTSEEDWLLPVGEKEPGFLKGLLGREGEKPTEPSFRVFRTDPFRVAVGEWVSPVIHVRGRASGTGEFAGVRTPSFPGWPWVRVLLLALALGLVVFLGIWLWDRRRGPVIWPDRSVASAGWLDTAPGFRDLLTEGALARGDARCFLDGLAGLARRYVGGRYGIAASEMTGPEMVTACRRLGYPLGPVRLLAGIVDEADRRRYDPEPPTPARCREQAVAFYSSVQSTRILPRQTSISPDRVLAAEKAWTAVARELDPTGRLVAASREGGS
jgi:hypothetical protein